MNSAAIFKPGRSHCVLSACVELASVALSGVTTLVNGQPVKRYVAFYINFKIQSMLIGLGHLCRCYGFWFNESAIDTARWYGLQLRWESTRMVPLNFLYSSSISISERITPWQRYFRIYGIASSGMYYFKDKWIYFDLRKSDSAKYALWRRKYMMLFSWRHGNVLVNVVKDGISQQ